VTCLQAGVTSPASRGGRRGPDRAPERRCLEV